MTEKKALRLNYTADCLLEVVTWQLHWALFFFSGLSISSTILSDNRFYLTHLAQFLASAVGNHSRWQLCHRASTHGWAASTFHNSCDGKRDTVTIVQKDQFVFGGYTDIPWGKPLTLVIYFFVMKRVLNKNISESLGLCM